MTLKDCYSIFGGDYESVLGRLISEKLVQKFIFKFLDDKSFELLKVSLEKSDYEEAFRAAHTIKGICQNLGFTKLLSSSSSLTEALRNKNYTNTDELFSATESDYLETVSAIKAFKSESEN